MILSGRAVLLLGLAVLPGEPARKPKPEAVSTLTIFAGTPAGLWRSQTWGNSWERVKGHGLEALGAPRVIVPVGPWVYLGGDEGLFVSEDFGENWTRSYSGSPVLSIVPSRYFQADPTVFVGTRDGLLKSDDAGRTFRPTPLKGTPVHRLEWPGPALLIGTGRGVVVTEDAGETFREADAGPAMEEVRSVAPSSFFILDPVLFAGVGSRGVFHSADAARTWDAAGLGGQTVADLVWLGPFLYAASDAGLFRTEDLGKTWLALNDGLQGRTPSRILFPLAPANGAEAFLATNRGVLWSGDGGFHWEPSGLTGEDVVSIGTFPPPLLTKRKVKK